VLVGGGGRCSLNVLVGTSLHQHRRETRRNAAHWCALVNDC
jgi:hypothetical protein